METTKLYIDGVWCEGAAGRRLDVRDPATERVVAAVAIAEASDVDAAVAAARRATREWRGTNPDERAAILGAAASLIAKRADTISLALTTEQGKTLAESGAEVQRAVETFSWHADHGPAACRPRHDRSRHTSVLPEPIGIVAAFTPWNYPAVIIARKLGAALMAGCPVVLKAAEETPTVGVMLVAALEDAGLPPGVVNLLFGDPPATSARLIGAADVRALSFTGSTAVGKQLAERAASSLTRCVLELGGHAPVLVLEDADLETAATVIAAYKFECAGQSCNAPSRIYVHESVYERFVDALVARAAALRVGDGRHPSTHMGPVANARRLAAMERLTADACVHGACVRTGGVRLDRGGGWFWSPTVLTDVGDGAALAHEEPFGPIVPVWSFHTLAEALRRANDTPYGLAGYIFTERADVALAAAAELETGSVGINALRGVPPDVGVAGVKDSGYGYEGGAAGMEAFMNMKVVRTR